VSMTSADMVRQNVERHSSKKGTTEMMNAPSPPSPVQDVFSVIQLISDPAAAKKRLAELNEAKAAAEKAQFSAADAKRLRAEHEKELAERQAKHDAEMSGERAFQDEQHRKRYDDLTAHERVLEQKESDLERRLREVAKQEADVSARSRKLREAINA
jgi:predicted  nucleic acid-binding Zn-ribbon protein